MIHLSQIKGQMFNFTLTPFDLKPQGGVRLLGIPAVLDRLIQQAISQVLQWVWEPVFSDASFGFRPKRCQHHQAVCRVVWEGRSVMAVPIPIAFALVLLDDPIDRLDDFCHTKIVQFFIGVFSQMIVFVSEKGCVCDH